MAEISLAGISKNFGRTSVLRDLSLDTADGEFLTLLGPSGCGKSTLLRIIAGLETQDRGSVSIGGRVVDHLRPKHRDVAMVFQSYALYPHLSVEANIALPLVMRRLTPGQRLPLIGRLLPKTRSVRSEIAQEVRQVAEAIEIAHLLPRKPGQLSGGQRQRVAVGRAMVRRPAVFLMDEPLSNLDAKLRTAMRSEIRELHRRLGITFIYVTHDQAEAMTLSDRVAVMLAGELIQIAPPQAIYSDPSTREVAEFIGNPGINMLEGRVRESRVVNVAGADIMVDAAAELDPGTRVTLGVRPEAFHLVDHASPTVITGRIRLLENLGSDLFVHIDREIAPEPLVARISNERIGDIRHDQIVHLGVRSEQVLVFDAQGRRIRARSANITRLRSRA